MPSTFLCLPEYHLFYAHPLRDRLQLQGPGSRGLFVLDQDRERLNRLPGEEPHEGLFYLVRIEQGATQQDIALIGDSGHQVVTLGQGRENDTAAVRPGCKGEAT